MTLGVGYLPALRGVIHIFCMESYKNGYNVHVIIIIRLVVYSIHI